MICLLNDFHNIQTVRLPGADMKLSLATHMASNLSKIHRIVTVQYKGQKFQLCKDIEFACILHLLDEVIPLSFFHYPVVFRSGNLSSYVPVTLKFALLFIIWRRHHYDRSTLSMLSDIYHQKIQFHQLLFL